MPVGTGTQRELSLMIRQASPSFLRLLCNLRWLAVLGQATLIDLRLGADSGQRKLAKRPGPERNPDTAQ
jgi:hypothetical protein